MKHLLIRCGTVLCTIAVVVTRFGVLSCRGRFYQPEEPAGLKNFLEKGDTVSRRSVGTYARHADGNKYYQLVTSSSRIGMNVKGRYTP